MTASWPRFLVSRALQLAALVVGAVSLLFIALRLSGSPAAVLSGPNASPEVIHATTIRLGLDRSWGVQYLDFLRSGFRLDFGNSFASGTPAFSDAIHSLPSTLRIMVPGLVLIVVLGVAVGLAAALYPSRRWPRFLEASAFGLQALPFFWLGIVLVLLLAIDTQVLPATGNSGFSSTILPAIVLATPQIAAVARLLRGELLDALSEPYAVTARSKGVSRRRLLLHHLAPNVLPTMISFLAVIFAFTLGAVVVVEPLFNYQGLGSLLVNGVQERDFPVVEAGVFLVAILVGLTNVLADVVSRLVAPEIGERAA